MKELKGNVRFWVLLFSFVFSLGVFLFIKTSIPSGSIQVIKLTQIYALTALFFLYVTLLATPLTRYFKWIPYRGEYIKSRRALGISAFYFGLLHASLAFFFQLGGFGGLSFLSDRYLIAITISFAALLILTVMAATAFDSAIERLGFARWKAIHRLVYLAGVLIIIHALMLGTHFQDLYKFVPQISFIGLAFLLFLESLRLDSWVKERFNIEARFSYATVLVLGSTLSGIIYFFLPIPGENGISFGIHSQHIQLAKEAQQGGVTKNQLNIPGLQGDKTKRYTLSFNKPVNVRVNQNTRLDFQVYDASSGNEVILFNKVYDKVVHLIVVDEELKIFNHIHPEQKGNTFTINTRFPKSGRYHLYVDFQPFGAIEQQIAFTLEVGNSNEIKKSSEQPDTQFTKTFGDYDVTLDFPRPLKSSQISIGQQLLKYTIKDSKTKSPITTLKPYLTAYGHVVMINAETFDYIHVHPNDLKVPLPDQSGGPNVEFMPLGLYGAIKPGVYRVFAQFNPDNRLFTSDFTVKID